MRNSITARSSLVLLLTLVDCKQKSQSIPEITNNAAVAEPNKPIPEIGDGDLMKEFADNQIAAEQKYKDRPIRAAGYVKTIARDILGSPYITFGDESVVQCSFPRNNESFVATLHTGHVAWVSCTVSGKFVNIVLKDCGPWTPSATSRFRQIWETQKKREAEAARP